MKMDYYLDDYNTYYINNEIYMIDLYNELGVDYFPNEEEIKNMLGLYLYIYFPGIKQNEFENIIYFLNKKSENEKNYIKSIYLTINNDNKMEKEITNIVEITKRDKTYKENNYFKKYNILQSVIHVNLKIKNDEKIDLYKIFNDFVLDSQYLFIQYMPISGKNYYKLKEDEIKKYLKDNIILFKWFDKLYHGISFKLRIDENNITKFISINLSLTGKIEYKSQWKEDKQQLWII